MSVRFRSLWTGIAIWLLLDLFMIKFGSAIPSWIAFDGRDAFGRDIWVVFFIAWMWIFFREPTQSPQGSEEANG